jgi:hypothetical protein
MRQTFGVKRAKRRLYVRINPCFIPVGRYRRACFDHLRKIRIGSDAKPPLPDRFC